MFGEDGWVGSGWMGGGMRIFWILLISELEKQAAPACVLRRCLWNSAK
jgi:hypothetical protein